MLVVPVRFVLVVGGSGPKSYAVASATVQKNGELIAVGRDWCEEYEKHEKMPHQRKKGAIFFSCIKNNIIFASKLNTLNIKPAKRQYEKFVIHR